jgi:thioredoxin-related protein
MLRSLAGIWVIFHCLAVSTAAPPLADSSESTDGASRQTGSETSAETEEQQTTNTARESTDEKPQDPVAAATVETEKKANTVPATTKTKRIPIYNEEANGKELIAAALKKAQRDHKHVLIEWGGNWCGWCYKLHDVFHKDEAVHPIVHEEFVLVLIDSVSNKELLLEYGGKNREYSFPHLTVLDEQGAVLTNQETGSLEEGPKHDPKLVSECLFKWATEKIDAETFLADALVNAAAEDKSVLVRIGTPYCGWCNVLAQFVQEHDSLIAADYVDIKIDTWRMTNGEQVAARLAPTEIDGVPRMVILDTSGKTLTSSFGPDGNIGYPFQPNEIAHLSRCCSTLAKGSPMPIWKQSLRI